MVHDEPIGASTLVTPMGAPRVLVVDDDEAVLITIRGILELDGYDIVSTSSAKEALERIRGEYFDAVLTDVRMDEVDGIDLLKELRRQGSQTAAVVLTGYASIDSVISALREGAYDYLVKPCEILDLRTTVARAIERTHLEAQLRERVRDLEQANETIRALNLELEARVEQATAALRDEIAAKDEFLSSISHDLKSPLTFIKGMANLRRRRAVATPENESLLDGLKQIEASAGRMSDLLDELVDAGRLESGREIELRREQVDLLDLAKMAAAEHQQTTDRHALYVTSAVPHLVGVWDALRLRRVLDNLLDNAVKYSPRGGTVEVRVASSDGAAVLTVSDRGEGIPSTDLPHIFERFRRGRNVGRIPGTGIGLAGVQRIVELHQGTISVESQVGLGTTFTIRLPLAVPTPAG
jgi:signal transduction histidine kinase